MWHCIGEQAWGVVGASCCGSSAQAPALLVTRAGSRVSAGTALWCAWVFLLATLFLAVGGSWLFPWHL